MEDKLLVYRLKAGSEDALKRIYEKYENYLFTIAVNLLHDNAAAEDIIQDVFMKFLKAIDNFKLRKNLKSYLATCTANKARDLLRKQKNQNSNENLHEKDMASNSKNPIQLIMQTEMLKKLAHALRNLPYEQREAVILRQQADMKFKAIAVLQNVSIKTAQSRYRYGLDKLRSLLNSEVQK